MNGNDAYISIRNVSKFFGTFQAINDVSLDIAGGEFFSLLGASGSGKTTLLSMLAGFEPATKGDIFIDGQSMNSVPPNHRPVNTVFQNYAIFPHLNVRDNIAYGLRKAQLSRAKRYEMVDEMLELIKLPGYGTRKAHQLSGGQRQRIALARALILRPKVLLLDEPLGALDKQLREQMQLELRALQRKVGITFVFVTHDQEEALALSDRIAVMQGGRGLQVDTPAGLYESPNSRAGCAAMAPPERLSKPKGWAASSCRRHQTASQTARGCRWPCGPRKSTFRPQSLTTVLRCRGTWPTPPTWASGAISTSPSRAGRSPSPSRPRTVSALEPPPAATASSGSAGPPTPLSYWMQNDRAV